MMRTTALTLVLTTTVAGAAFAQTMDGQSSSDETMQGTGSEMDSDTSGTSSDMESGGSDSAMGEQAEGTIVETAEQAGDFSTLLTAVEEAGLAEELSTGGPFTVLAPTDAAFDALEEGTLDGLLADTDQLVTVLQNHLIVDTVMSGDLTDGQQVVTAAGETLTVSIDGDTVMIGDATVTQPDVEATNGVIHAIDTVLVP